MTLSIRNPKDFWAGTIYAAVGLGALLIARGYAFGSGARMGPGYFPSVLGALLTIFGLTAIVRSLTAEGDPVGPIAWKPLLLITGGIVLFGFLLPAAGFVIAAVVFLLMAAAASEQFQFDPRALFGLVALIAFCGLVFVKGLGVPMPLLGTWFVE
jgi:Tripartite tricarboxylate transporter TctB family